MEADNGTLPQDLDAVLRLLQNKNLGLLSASRLEFPSLNQLWRLETNRGPFLLKVYQEKHGAGPALNRLLNEVFVLRNSPSVPHLVASSSHPLCIIREYVKGTNLKDVVGRTENLNTPLKLLSTWLFEFHRAFQVRRREAESAPAFSQIKQRTIELSRERKIPFDLIQKLNFTFENPPNEEIRARLVGDSRLDNFILGEDGKLKGIDFEHSRIGSVAEDLAWVISQSGLVGLEFMHLGEILVALYQQISGSEISKEVWWYVPIFLIRLAPLVESSEHPAASLERLLETALERVS